MKHLIILTTTIVVVASGFLGVKVDTSTSSPGWISFNEAQASPYRRSVRRTARRTSRRTAHRHHYYGAPVVVGAAVVTTIAIGTIVATLPPSCSTMFVHNINYYYCAGHYYTQSGNQWLVATAPY